VLVYSGTHTAGYNFTSMYLILAAMFSDLIFKHRDKLYLFKKDINIIFLGICLTSIFTIIKLNGPMYDWWGLRQEGATEAKYSLPFNELKGFRVDNSTADFFGKISQYGNTIKQEDSIFAYPSIPIVYLLLNKLPIINYPVLWFDVSEQSQSISIIKKLEFEKPNIIFWLKPPDFVYSGHANLRRLPSLIYFVDDWILKQIILKNYKMDSYSFFDTKKSWMSTNNEIIEKIPTVIFVTNENLTCSDLSSKDGIMEINCRAKEKFIIGDKINIVFKNKISFEKNINNIGFPVEINSFYSFLVLKRI
jgi:hypothetical protein